ncbi:hypothetical protein LC613_38855 [Nostoc sphaeroides CHAB 2801]|uniref:hypothetical protein n=1 Tax=Nostoc sphaeroides TaxID=446679 RepID=UPI001E5FDCA0|nr:hypothetical protein [Nostoc sphaeroides]MCC5633428.1 hypothetical protein [Nostoc sphaeroides CHAB 2801]
MLLIRAACHESLATKRYWPKTNHPRQTRSGKSLWQFGISSLGSGALGRYRLRRMSTLLHIYYVFSSTLLASCSEVMTFGCELVAE